jgi:mannosyltransferase
MVATAAKMSASANVSERRPSRQSLVALGIVLLAFALRVTALGAQSLWNDEAFSVTRAALGPWLAAVGDETQPPLYHALLAAWVALAGTSEFSARFFSLVPSVAAVALAWRAGCAAGGRAAGTIAALLLASSALAVYFAQEARMYALAASLVLAALLGAWRLWTAAPGEARPGGRLYVGATVALLYTHFLGWLVLALMNLAALVAGQRAWQWRGAWLRAQRRVLLYSLFNAFFLARFFLTTARNPRSAPVTIGDLFGAPLRLQLGPAPPDPLPMVGLAIGGLAALAVVTALFRPAGHGRAAAPALVAWLAVPGAFLLVLWLLSLRGMDLFQPRYLSLALPAVAVGVAVLLARLPPALRALLVSGVVGLSLVAVFAVYRAPEEQRTDWRGLAGGIAAAERPADLVVLDQGWSAHAFLYYYRGRSPVVGVPIQVDPFRLSFPPAPADGTGWQTRLETALAGTERVWYVRYLPNAFPTPEASDAWFGERGFRARDRASWREVDQTLFAR